MAFYIIYLFVLIADTLSQQTFLLTFHLAQKKLLLKVLDDYKGTQISDVRILYLLGELARRTDKEDAAVSYFSKVIESRKRTVETKLIEMAQDRWKEIRENRKNKVEL